MSAAAGDQLAELMEQVASLRIQLDARLIETAVTMARNVQLQTALDGIREFVIMAGPGKPLHVRVSSNNELCRNCQHALGPHVMITLSEWATDGVATICDQPGCGCITTTAAMPNEDIIAELRDIAQHPH
jgi:hypothetical protein